MKLSTKYFVISKLTKRGEVNNTLNIINRVIDGYEIASFSASYFS